MSKQENTKDLSVTSIEDAKTKVPDIQVFGNGDLWQLLSKASSKEGGWMKSTKAMDIINSGVVLQVTTQQGEQVSEALVFVPNANISVDASGNKCLKAY